MMYGGEERMAMTKMRWMVMMVMVRKDERAKSLLHPRDWRGIKNPNLLSCKPSSSAHL